MQHCQNKLRRLNLILSMQSTEQRQKMWLNRRFPRRPRRHKRQASKGYPPSRDGVASE
jgi:hypothetical protein